MKNAMITIKVDEQFRDDLQKLAKNKNYNGVSEMIRHEYQKQIDGLNNMVKNEKYIFDFFPVLGEMIDNIGAYDEISEELLRFIFEYMTTNQDAMTSLYNKFMMIKATEK